MQKLQNFPELNWDKKTSKFETIFPKCQQSNVAFFRSGFISFDKTFVRNLDNVYIRNDVKAALLIDWETTTSKHPTLEQVR